MRLIIVLTIVCIVSALLLGLTYDITRERIVLQEQKEENEAVRFVLPDAVKVSSKITGKEMDYYEGYDSSGKATGYAFVGKGKGYSSTIRIMVGVGPDMNILGIKILSEQETPGLGNRVDEVKSTGTLWDILKGKKLPPPGQPWFQAQFRGRSPDTLNEVKFITGATITSKAVLDIVRSTIEKFQGELKDVRG